MAKILYLITQSEAGGAQKNVLDLAQALKEKYEVLVAAGPDGGGAFFDQLEKAGVNFKRLRWLRRSVNPFFDLLAFFEIKKLLEKEKPAVLHLHSSKAGFLGSLAADSKKIKIVYTVHGAVFEAPFNLLSKKLFLWLEKLMASRKHKIICVSGNDKKLWLKHKAAPEEKLVVIHNGLDFAQMDFLPKDRARENLFSLSAPLFEAASGSGLDLKIIGTVANFYPEKGLPYFIEAANIMSKIPEFKNLIFIVIGEGLERELLEEIIKEHGLENKFVLAGRVENSSRYLKALDVFVLPSIKEGLPYTILEAMAAGLPVVASFIGGIPEMIKNEENGFLVLPKNPEMLAKKITELLQNPDLAEKFVQNSQKKLTAFSLDKMIKQTQEIYEQ